LILKTGLQEIVLRASPVSGGTITKDLSIQSDAALFMLWVNSTAGDITVEVFGILDSDGREVLLATFPKINAPSTEILQKRTGTAPTRLRVKVTHTGACDFELSARAVSTGSSDTRILGGASLKVSQKTIGPAPSLLVPASLVDRTAVALKNWSPNHTIYVAETEAKANINDGWPIGPKDALGLDIQAGVELYASTSNNNHTCDIRIIESGG
jgi:hypothetical protein